MKEITMQDRRALAGRIAKLNFLYTDEYLQNLEKAEAEKKEAEAMKEKGEFRCMVMTGESNAKVSLSCMKDCADIIHFLNNKSEDVEAWQMAGITAMLDQSNEDEQFDYDLPCAISDVLGIRFTKG